jgi:transposase, IS5 family
MADNDDGVVLDNAVEQGNPRDAPQPARAVQRVAKTPAGRSSRAVTADRGYGEAKTYRELTHLGVNNVVIPRTQTFAGPTRRRPQERTRWYQNEIRGAETV